METIGPEPSSQIVTRSSLVLRMTVPAAVLCLSIVAGCYFLLLRQPVAAIVPAAEAEAPPRPEEQEATRNAIRMAFFETSVAPSLQRMDLENRRAAMRCVERLRGKFSGFRDGISPFIDDVTSWGTRLNIVKRMPSDWWYEKADASAYVQQRLEEHVFSEGKIKDAVQEELSQFGKDLDANRNAMLADIRAAVTKSDLPAIKSLDLEALNKHVKDSLTEMAKEAAEGSVIQLVIGTVASMTAESIATAIVAAITTRVGVSAAASSLAAGGSTVGGGAAGAAGGTVGGPVGTIAGLAVGLVLGYLVDWWLEDSFRTELSEKLDDLISQVELAALVGDKDGAGIECELYAGCDAVRDATSQAIYQLLVGKETR